MVLQFCKWFYGRGCFISQIHTSMKLTRPYKYSGLKGETFRNNLSTPFLFMKDTDLPTCSGVCRLPKAGVRKHCERGAMEHRGFLSHGPVG